MASTKVSNSSGRCPYRACQSCGSCRALSARILLASPLTRTHGRIRNRPWLTIHCKLHCRRSSLHPIQSRDPDTLLLEYSLGEQRGFLWLVSSSAISSVVLPKRSEIEQAAKRFYDALSSPEGSAREEAGRKLSRMLLGDAAPSLGNKRL